MHRDKADPVIQWSYLKNLCHYKIRIKKVKKSLDLGTFYIHKHLFVLLYMCFYPLNIKYCIAEILLSTFCDLNILSSFNWKTWMLQGGFLGFQGSLSPSDGPAALGTELQVRPSSGPF